MRSDNIYDWINKMDKNRVWLVISLFNSIQFARFFILQSEKRTYVGLVWRIQCDTSIEHTSAHTSDEEKKRRSLFAGRFKDPHQFHSSFVQFQSFWRFYCTFNAEPITLHLFRDFFLSLNRFFFSARSPSYSFVFIFCSHSNEVLCDWARVD